MSSFSLTDRQVRVLRAVCDTIVPSLEREQDAFGFWARAGSDLELVRAIGEVLGRQSPEQQASFKQLLDLLGSPLAGVTAGGGLKSFAQMTAEERSALLLRWSYSRIGLLRQGFQALKRLVTFLFYALTDEAGHNPNWAAIGYAGPLSPPPQIERAIRPLRVTEDTTLTCDTVVVGSGAGGGVVAGELAEGGQEVIVVEKGPYVAEDGFTQREAEMLATLYEAGGSLTTTDGGVVVLAGSCLGGGTTVNWAAAFRTPDYVLEEWAREHLLPHLLTEEYSRSFDAVEAAAHVDSHESPCNPQNQALWDGAVARGVHVKAIPRNVNGCDYHACGYCCFGCQYGAKQGTLKTYLQRAFDAGARILPDTTVERVLVQRGEATGVQAVHRGEEGKAHSIHIRAKRVVVAAGALHTPALLRRSGLAHPHIGRHLYLHPTVAVAGLYEREMNPWFGVMMAAVSDEWARLDGAYGVKIETPPAHPGLLALALPWQSGGQHKEMMLRSARIGAFIVLTRDREGGRVSVDKRGQPLLHYQLSAYDRRHMWRGIAEASRLHAAAGAKMLLLPHNQICTHDLAGGDAALEVLCG
ncbi:MAG: FAD-dependent oxidoreductase, partial [Ardenticatenaceae bacterium]